MSEWEELNETATISLEAMDKLVADMRKAREAYEGAKDAATIKHNEYEAKQKLVLDALKSTGRDKYEAPGVALVYISSKEVYRVPQTPEKKRLLFQYIESKYGTEALTSMLSINHNSLNSWANKETESGEVMEIPGLEQPTIQETINMRRK